METFVASDFNKYAKDIRFRIKVAQTLCIAITIMALHTLPGPFHCCEKNILECRTFYIGTIFSAMNGGLTALTIS